MKPRMKDIIEQLERTLRIEQEGIRERDQKIAIMEAHLQHYRQIASCFDRLIDGVCMGMKEGSLPRRTHL